jgi:glycosyltransferase involved in cell wall biosynthesis
LRITIIGPAYPLKGGIAQHVYLLWQALQRLGHQAQVISFKRLYPKFLLGTTTDNSSLKFDPQALPILDPYNPATWLKAYSAIKQFCPDAIIIQWWNPLFSPVTGSLARLFKKAGIETIIDCHNVLPHERTIFDLLLTDFAFSPVASFITHSIKVQQELLAIFPEKSVHLAQLSVPAQLKEGVTRARSGRKILFFGLIRKYKGLDVLLRAMPKVLSEVDCQLLVAGEFYDSIEKYDRIIRECGIQRRVSIENRYIKNEEVSGLFADADVLVMPYLSATQSGVAQMAIANRLPIIASDVGGLREVVIHNVNGLLVPPGDPSALADAIVNYFINDLGPTFARNMQAISSEWTCLDLGRLVEELVQAKSLSETGWLKR